MRTEQGRAAPHFGSSNDGLGQHSATGDRSPARMQLDNPLQTEAQTRQTLLANETSGDGTVLPRDSGESVSSRVATLSMC